MKILMVCETFPATASEDPLIPAHLGLARALKQLGHEIKVLSFCNPVDRLASEGAFEFDGIRVHHIRPRTKTARSNELGMPTFARMAAASQDLFLKLDPIVKQFQPDIIDCHEFNGIGFFYAQDHNYPLVVHCYGPLAHLMKSGYLGEVNELDSELIDMLEQTAISEADALIACSADVAKRISQKCGRPLDQFEIIRVPLVKPNSLPNPESTDQQSFPKLFSFGQVSRQKGADLLLNSLPWIAKKFPNFKLYIGGEQPKERGRETSYADVMRAELEKMGLSKNVEFLDRLSRDQIKQNVINADVCIFPSIYETAGYACLEAVSYGGAVVATAVGGLPEYHKHGESAWLVPPNSAKDLADGIIHVSENDPLRLRLKKEGWKHISHICHPDDIASATIRVYENAIANFATKPATNRSFRIISGMVPALLDATRSVNQSTDATTIVHNLGNMVMGHLSRVWKEGYEAGLQDGLKRNEQQNNAISMKRLMHYAAKRLKNN